MSGSLGGLIAAFPTPVTSSFESIATFTPTSGSSVTFSSIPSTYKSLQIRMFVRDTGFSDVWMRYNGDTAANYAWHRLRGTSNTATAAGVASNSYIVTGNSMSYTSQGGVSIIDIVDYASTSKNKTSKTLRGYDDSSDGQIILGSGLWMSTAAINSITLLLSGGTFSTGTTIALYGIKG